MQLAAAVSCLLLIALTSQAQAQRGHRETNWRGNNPEESIIVSSGDGVPNAEIVVRPEVLQQLQLRKRPIKKHFSTIPEWVLGRERPKPSVVHLLPEGSADHEQYF